MKKQVDEGNIYITGVLLVLAFAGVIYYLLDRGGLEQTSALFIGIAAVLAVGLSLLPASNTSLTGKIVMGTALPWSWRC
ncbi:MAG: hypothetical protein GWM98_26025 [Nitrospinaceae bacterium]|nr:hypothetical protein [Nitrospinaceae bacterium]NIR57293.1 hypothetical protein [Nitrospinaceae bacterium]NIS87745.1 hypothetical protein [Nitrospinaceae bacterium]NIT84615.1 hypothetical protein [Nitrospinaceae bacterium]NIU46794.1 hypothetical protein [Nitrospinaceae bacterium]